MPLVIGSLKFMLIFWTALPQESVTSNKWQVKTTKNYFLKFYVNKLDHIFSQSNYNNYNELLLLHNDIIQDIYYSTHTSTIIMCQIICLYLITACSYLHHIILPLLCCCTSASETEIMRFGVVFLMCWNRLVSAYCKTGRFVPTRMSKQAKDKYGYHYFHQILLISRKTCMIEDRWKNQIAILSYWQPKHKADNSEQ